MARKIQIGRRRVSLIQLVSAVAVVVLAVGTVGLVWVFDRNAAISKAAAWTPVGAPCPSASAAALAASGARADHVTIYDYIRFGRAYGYVNCNEIADQAGRGSRIVSVCQFNNPSVLQVTTARGDFYYATQSHPASVLVVDGQPRCVLAITITLG